MPWNESNRMDERIKFVARLLSLGGLILAPVSEDPQAYPIQTAGGGLLNAG